jgi:acyl-CoA thioesterase-1
MSILHPFRHLAFSVLLLFSPLLLAAEKPGILVLGDSLSAGYGIDLKEGWVNLLVQRLADDYPHQVINASVSGETSGGGLARLPALLKEHQPSLVILELGGNDGLRGHPLNIMQQQLDAIIQQSRQANAQVLLLGMQIPPNYGQRYTQQFHQVYTTLAEKYKLAYVPFFLEGIAVNPDFMQRDGIHPTAEAQPLMLDNVWVGLKPLLEKTE